jgi:hypothetical protein
MALHGPHHAAQKSTTTGISLRWMCTMKLFVVAALGAPVNIAWWQRPHLALFAGFSAGMRFTLWQCGQTMCRGSLITVLHSLH